MLLCLQVGAIPGVFSEKGKQSKGSGAGKQPQTPSNTGV